MATTLDHISNGRAILGVGASWYEDEARAFGIDVGTGPGERLRWLGEALPIMRGMLDGVEPTATGPRYSSKATRNDPPPSQEHLPILIGGSGPKVTLRLVARYADMSNIGGDPDSIRMSEQILLRHCASVGRDPKTIERTASVGSVIIRDDEAEAQRVSRTVFDHNLISDWKHICGTPSQVASALAPYIGLGYFHFLANFPAPYHDESMTRFATDVRPLLEQVV